MVDPALLHAWLSGRSIARGLPEPVPDHGGFRVDTGSEDETARYVFSEVTDELVALARSIIVPRLPVKACATGPALLTAVPIGWRLHDSGYFMTAGTTSHDRAGADGYTLNVDLGAVIEVNIISADGTLAASGYGVETDAAFVYDRITVAPEHRRRGLGTAVMIALGRERRDAAKPQLLTATEAGRTLYESLGWRTISPYSTASFTPTRTG